MALGWLLPRGLPRVICALGMLVVTPSLSGSQETSNDELLAAAEARIEEHRKAEAAVLVIDAAGNPMPGIEVVVEQTGHAFLFGSNLFEWGRLEEDKEAAYRERFAELFNYATLPFYWSSYEPNRGEPNHEYTEKVARWCAEHHIATKGHPLAWNSGDPSWLPDDLKEVEQLQMARIEDCVTRFSGLIDRWDVVNEVTHFDRTDFVENRAPILSATWKQIGQVEFARECFTHARKAGPKATLVINDYETAEAYEKVIEQLLNAQGERLYNAIGIQSHMHNEVWTVGKTWEVCERFARFDVPLHFTETTILSGKQEKDPATGAVSWPSTPEGESLQAEQTVQFYTVLFSHPAVEAITWWDLSDYRAWQGAPAGLLHPDMTPKPVYEELKKLIKDTWWTRTTLQTGEDGTVSFRGFLGSYNVSASHEQSKGNKQFVLGKDVMNRWVIELK